MLVLADLSLQPQLVSDDGDELWISRLALVVLYRDFTMNVNGSHFVHLELSTKLSLWGNKSTKERLEGKCLPILNKRYVRMLFTRITLYDDKVAFAFASLQTGICLYHM